MLVADEHPGVWWTAGVICMADLWDFEVFKLKPLPLTSLGETEGKMFPHENIEVICLESGLIVNHHKVFCTLSLATCDIQ